MATHRPDHGSHEAVLDYWRIVKTHRYVVLAMFALGVLASITSTHLMTPIYRATARVLVEDETPRMVGVQVAYPVDMPQERYYRTQVELIKSRPVLRAVALRLRLETWEEFAGGGDIASALAARVTVKPLRNTKLIDVSFEGPDKTKVADVANAIVECFGEDSIQWGQNSSKFATGWIGKQVPRLRADVMAAEGRLREFQEEHKILSLDREQSIVSQRLVQLSKDVTNAERARIDLEAELIQLDAAQEDPRVIEFLPAAGGTQAFRQLESLILSLQSQRTGLLKVLRHDHRDVRALDAKIAEARAEYRAKVNAAISAFKRRAEAARFKERALREALELQEKKALELNEKLVRLNALQQEVQRAKELYEPMLQRWGELGLASGLNTVPVQIREPAEEPLYPVKPRRKLIVAAGALLGLLVGLRLAFLLERSYSKIRSAEELEHLAGLRALGTVPHMTAKEENKLYLACHFDPKSSAAEAYRSIRTGLLLSAGGDGPCVLLVTSAVDQEGKTTTALNIASALAQTQKRALLVDADMRRSSVHRPLGIEKGAGLSTCLSDGVEPKEVVRESEVPSLSIITAGPTPENPSELLGSKAMSSFLEWARQDFDFIVIDSPPVAAVTDASVLAPVADGVLMVVRADRTLRRAASSDGS